MALNIAAPFIHVEDSNGLPYVGAKLYVYLPGTTTLASIYSDDGLSVPMTNPLAGVNASDAAGNFPRVYIAAGTYKLRAVTSADVLIWEWDNIDTGLQAATGALPISRGGTGATTAAGARTNLDVPSNSELADLADDISDIQSSLQNIVSAPQGYLTPTSGVVVISSSVTAGTAVYYTPDSGNLCPIYDGVQFNVTEFAELTLTLNSNHVANGIYDVFVINDSGTVRLVTGPVWNTVTAGSGARGTGAGTTELSRVSGILGNAFSMTARNGSDTYTVGANEGTYVGTILMTGTNGQITCTVAAGTSRFWSIFNAYNRRPRTLLTFLSTASWNYGTATVRAPNGDSTISVSLVCGLAEEEVTSNARQEISTNGGNAISAQIGVGWNSITVISGNAPILGAANGTITRGPIAASYVAPPFLGRANVTFLENSPSASSTAFNGTQAAMQMAVSFRA